MAIKSLALAALLASADKATLAERPSLRGTVGMQHTQLAVAGKTRSLRVALQSDFFVQQDVFCCTGPVSDRHQRHRTFFSLGWTPLAWLELQIGLEHAVNRNERQQDNRQDPAQIYAMGDSYWKVKLLAPWWKKALRVAINQEIQVLSGPGHHNQGKVRYGVDLLGTYLLRKTSLNLPIRIAASLGVLFDRSHQMYDWTRFADPVSQEVFRFGVGSHQDRLRTRLGIDAPLAFGTRRTWGLTPMFEIQWDRSFSPLSDSELPSARLRPPSTQQSAVQTSVGLAVHPSTRIFIDLGYQVTLLQPDLHFGPKSAPWMMSLSLGGSFEL